MIKQDHLKLVWKILWLKHKFIIFKDKYQKIDAVKHY